MSRLLRFVPAGFIRAIGRLQFKFPAVQPFIRWASSRMVGTGVIQRGPGKGLWFNATGCNPGYLAGTSVPLEQELVCKYSKPGRTVYDLGANAGFYAILAARAVGPSGNVFAFEPSPALCERIRENAQRNGFQHLRVVQAAVCDIDGEIDFGMAGDLSVENSIGRATPENARRVKSITLDTFIQDNPPPDLLLIDIEGAEISALRGAIELLTRFKPMVMVEVHWLGEGFNRFFSESLQPLGYRLSQYDGTAPPAGEVRYHALLRPPE